MNGAKRWGYVVTGVIVLFFAGMIYAWSIISKTFVANFPEWSTAQLSMNFTITMAMFCIGALLTSFLEKKFSVGARIRIAGVVIMVGYLLTSMVSNLPMLYVGFGVLSGIGAGIAYSSVISTVTAWFPDKRGLVSGVLLMGFGFSSFILGKIYTAVTHLDTTDTWRLTFRVFAILIVVLFIVLGFFIKKPTEEFLASFQVNNVGSTERYEADTKTMLRHGSFWCYFIYAVLLSAVGLVLVSQASQIATDVGTTVAAGTIATVVGLISVMNGVGRVIFGSLYDKIGYRKTMMLDIIVFLLTEGFLFMAITQGNFMLIIVGFVVGGFAYGGVTPMNAAIIDEFFGRKHYTSNFSIVNLNLLVASFASTIAGSLYDRSQSYVTSIIMMVVFSVVAFVLIFGIRKPEIKK